MKTLKINHEIKLDEISKVEISNELFSTCLIQSMDDGIHIQTDLYLDSSSENNPISGEDFIEIKTDASSGNVKIDIQDFSLDDKDAEISSRSTITIAIPSGAAISAETDNYSITVKQMQNSFELHNENGSIQMLDCTGDVEIQNENGSIKLVSITGDINIEQENGSISTDHLSGNGIKIQTENGSVKMRENHFTNVEISSENGSVFYESQPLEAGSFAITNENGNIHLALAPMQGFKLKAITEMGQIKNSFLGATHTANGEYSFDIGDQSLGIHLTTENGGIKITSGDMTNGDYLKGKFETIKDLLRDNSEESINEAKKLINQLIASLLKMMEGVNNDVIKDKIKDTLDYLNTWKEKVNDTEAMGKVKVSIDGISQDINKAVQEAMKTAQEALKLAQEKFQADFKPQYEKQFAKAKDFFKSLKSGNGFPPFAPPHPPHPSHDREAMQEKSRMKILEMLEAGKITAEEAERLLKAIH